MSEETSFFLSHAQACHYLPGRESRHVFLNQAQISPEHYDTLMANGFRRSGEIIYRPHCVNCQECKATRIPVQEFEPSKSQRRCLRKNADIEVTWHTLTKDQEHQDIYDRYQKEQQDGTMSADADKYLSLFDHPSIEICELQFRLQNKLIGVSIIDITQLALSSVYFYFDPNYSHRSLGTFSALIEIEEAFKLGKLYWYIGYAVDGCEKMSYKKRFKPQQVFGAELWNTI